MIVSGFKPWPFFYRMDLNSNKSQKGSLGVYSMRAFAADFLTIVLGVLASCDHLMMDLNSDESQKSTLGVYSPVAFAADIFSLRSLSSPPPFNDGLKQQRIPKE